MSPAEQTPAPHMDTPQRNSDAPQPVAQTPEQIRAQIEETRGQLSDTVEELAAKTDVKAQASARAGALKERAVQAVPGSAQQGMNDVGAVIRRRPAAATAIGGLAGGLLIGWLLGRS